jgi:hypothetical protein
MGKLIQFPATRAEDRRVAAEGALARRDAWEWAHPGCSHEMGADQLLTESAATGMVQDDSWAAVTDPEAVQRQ